MTGLADLSLAASIQPSFPGPSLRARFTQPIPFPLVSSHRSCPQQYSGTFNPILASATTGGPWISAYVYQPDFLSPTFEAHTGPGASPEEFLSFCLLKLMLPIVQGPEVGTGTLDWLGPLGGLPVPTRMRMGLLSLRPRHLCCCCSVPVWGWPLHPLVTLL